MCRPTSRAAGRVVQGDGPLFVRECAIASLPHYRGFVLGQVPRVDVEMHSILFAHHVVELVELYLFRGSVPLRVLLSSRAPLRRWFRQCGSTVIDARRPVVMAQ